jgi:ubiquinone/menaquinone biosynthesis C-methylase UbiE
MIDSGTHEDLVERQFGPQAGNYLKSAVHAGGEDLDALVALASSSGAGRVLDLGCGAGHVSFAAARTAQEVVAYDLSPEMLSVMSAAAAEKGLAAIRTQNGSAERLPFEDGSFDCVLSRFSAHHWRDLPAALREAARVTRTGGFVGIVDAVSSGVPLFDTWLQAVELLRDPSHVRDYAYDEWIRAAAQARLTVDCVRSFQLRLDFRSWVERIATPAQFVDAIRALQATASTPVVDHFRIEADGSFNIRVALFRFVAA